MNLARLVSRLLLVVMLFAQLGCEIFRGPIIVNRSTVPLTVTATFSGWVSEIQLQPGHRLVQRERRRNLEALRVSDGVNQWDFSSADIQRALAEGGGAKHAVVELLGAQIRGSNVGGQKR